MRFKLNGSGRVMHVGPGETPRYMGGAPSGPGYQLPPGGIGSAGGTGMVPSGGNAAMTLGGGMPATSGGGGVPASTDWEWFRRMLMGGGGGGAPALPGGSPGLPGGGRALTPYQPPGMPAQSSAPGLPATTSGAGAAPGAGGGLGSLLGMVGPGASALAAVQAMHAAAPDSPEMLASRHAHAQTAQQGLRDRMSVYDQGMGPQMPPGFTGPEQGPPMPQQGTGTSGLQLPQGGPQQGPPMPPPMQGPPMPPGMGSLGGSRGIPMPQARPQQAPFDPNMIPGYNPNVSNMADPAMSQQRFGANTMARQVPDGNGGMMNDFYLGDPHKTTNGPALIQKMLAMFHNQ